MSDNDCILSHGKDCFPVACIPILLKYLELSEILKHIIVLNKKFRELTKQENYLLFKHFLKHFNLHERLRRAEIPA